MSHTYIIVDTEYTTFPGALESDWSLPGQQKEIIQIAAIKVDQNFNEMGKIDLLAKPVLNPVLSSLFIDLTGITQQDVDQNGLSFSEALEQFYYFCDLGKTPVICMNSDETVLRKNCALSGGIIYPFKNSFHRLRPYLERLGVDTQTHSSGDLHTLTPQPLASAQTHYALHDVRSMAHWLKHMQEQKIFKSVDRLPTGAPKSDPRATLKPKI